MTISDLSLQDCARELNSSYNDICALATKKCVSTTVVAFQVLDNYKIKVSPETSLFSFSEEAPREITFVSQDAKKAFDRYTALVYTFISKARVYDTYAFPDFSMTKAEQNASRNAWGSLSTPFAENHFALCRQKVAELAKKKFSDPNLTPDWFSAHVLKDNSILFGAYRAYQHKLLPFVAKIFSNKINESDLEVLKAYRLSRYVVTALDISPTSPAIDLLRESNLQIKTFIRENNSYENPVYQILPGDRMKIRDGQNQDTTQVIEVADIKMLENHQVNVLALALAGEYRADTISKELADANFEKSKEEIEAIVHKKALVGHKVNPNQILGFRFTDDLLRIDYNTSNGNVTLLLSLSEEEKAIFSLYRVYENIAKTKEPMASGVFTTLYKVGAYFGLYQVEES